MVKLVRRVYEIWIPRWEMSSKADKEKYCFLNALKMDSDHHLVLQNLQDRQKNPCLLCSIQRKYSFSH